MLERIRFVYALSCVFNVYIVNAIYDMQSNIRLNNKRRMACALIIIAAVILASAGVGFARAEQCAVAAPVECDTRASDPDLVRYDGKIEHIFTHELIFDTDKAFSPKNSLRDCFDKDHLTAKEFSALLDELYKNDYVLIGLDTALSEKPLFIPRGKRPVVMSFDDMTYDTVGRGCIDKIILSDGQICDYTASAVPQITRERENVTILESFIASRPDFSFDGCRATICVNGYNGILGYRVTPDCRVSDAYMNKEIAACKELVRELKARGYSFASHTYYHKYFDTTSAQTLEKDCAAWEKYIEPIVGETETLCYPAGKHNAASAKNGIFKKHGFKVFLCVGDFDGTEEERADVAARYVYRLPFDGTALRLYGNRYARMADVRAIYDSARFRPFSYKGFYH